jgi:hypothetical protein
VAASDWLLLPRWSGYKVIAMNRHPQPTSNAKSNPPGDSSAGQTDPRDLPPAEALGAAFGKLRELREYFAYYLAAKRDLLKLTLRQTAIRAAIGLVGLIALTAIVVTASVLLCVGLAQLVSTWCGGRAWAGNLVVGVLLLALLAGGMIFGARYLSGMWRKQTVQNYELRRKRQRADFGHDVARDATTAAANTAGQARR